MNIHQMAALLDGREYLTEMTMPEEAAAKAAGLVVVFGASDDLMEFRGAIHDEVGAWDGTTVYLTGDGLLKNDCENDDCPHFAKLKNDAKTIVAAWDENGFSWVMKTTMPHENFVIMEDGDTYCRGLVFRLADAAPATPIDDLSLEQNLVRARNERLEKENTELRADKIIQLNDGCWVATSHITEIKVNERAGLATVRMKDGVGHSIAAAAGETIYATVNRLAKKINGTFAGHASMEATYSGSAEFDIHVDKWLDKLGGDSA